ncbi:hypothetical protein Desdi_1670 [Desulfitobacterium dichloroeliminans LMG P-21439]|uniref:Uncharacterized protein n=1 Tax=Desulfitobacterium dichloroeliminans (strain LMG P-21439 / DCA1) TaxID=871963 RepID=L0F5Q9_DESDL|nr:hypothetical protein [Desulfitobacterium dichloroeliminans]AGA69159.1 hypothetical protein Desdi_1670 [Desulfitobacterium dichloroeliminans LMG P-21439]
MSDCCQTLANISQKYASLNKNSGIRELCEREKENYEEIYAELIRKYIEKAGEIANDISGIQIINKFTTNNDVCVYPGGLVNVSLEYLAKLLTFADTAGYEWEVDFVENNNTHFRNLYNCIVKVKCSKEEFVDMAVGKGFRCA